MFDAEFPSYREAKRQFDARYFREALERYDGNITHAAKAVGIDRSHFHDKMQRAGLRVAHRVEVAA